MKWLVVVIVAVVFSLAISVYRRRVKKRRFRRFLQDLPEQSDEVVARVLPQMNLEECLALRKVLEGKTLSTEEKVRISRALLAHGRFSLCLSADYLVNLMFSAEAPLQQHVARCALDHAKSDSAGLQHIVRRLDTIGDSLLVEFLIDGLADIAVAIPCDRRWHPLLPVESDRTLVVRKVAELLGAENEAVRRTAAKHLNTKLSDYLGEVEGVLMGLLRDSRRTVKELVAMLTLDNEEVLKAAMCCVRGVTHDLSPELRARL